MENPTERREEKLSLPIDEADAPLLRSLLDAQGRVSGWPSKQGRKAAVLRYLSQLFEKDRVYTEKEVNALLTQAHTFNDYFILRRGLIEAGLLCRTRSGSAYWLPREDGSLPDGVK